MFFVCLKNNALWYLLGVVLFPEATLPLRVVQPNFISAVERALVQVESPYIVGVVSEHYLDAFPFPFSVYGTKSFLRKHSKLGSGSCIQGFWFW